MWLFVLCFYNLSNFCFCLSSVADFLNTGARASISAGRAPFLLARKAMRFGHVVWVWVMIIFQWLCFIFIQRRHLKIWVAVDPRLNYLFLAVYPRSLSAQYLVKRAVDPFSGSSAFTTTALLPMASEVYLIEKKKEKKSFCLTSCPSSHPIYTLNLNLV